MENHIITFTNNVSSFHIKHVIKFIWGRMYIEYTQP